MPACARRQQHQPIDTSTQCFVGVRFRDDIREDKATRFLQGLYDRRRTADAGDDHFGLLRYDAVHIFVEPLVLFADNKIRRNWTRGPFAGRTPHRYLLEPFIEFRNR